MICPHVVRNMKSLPSWYLIGKFNKKRDITLLQKNTKFSFVQAKGRESLKNTSFNFKNHIAEYYTVFGTKT